LAFWGWESGCVPGLAAFPGLGAFGGLARGPLPPWDAWAGGGATWARGGAVLPRGAGTTRAMPQPSR
jgi:hypothetical protein